MNIIFFQYVNQLWKCRCDENALFIFYTLNSLTQHFFNNNCQIISGLSFWNFIQVHKYSNKRRLAISGHKCDDLVLYHLNALDNFIADAHFCYTVDGFFVRFLSQALVFSAYIPAEFFPADLYKGCQVRQGNALTAILRTCNLCNNLCGNITCGRKAVGLLDHCFADNSTVLQHILQIYQTAVMHVLRKIIGIMEMNNASLMRICDIMRQQKTGGDILADFTGHIVTLYAVYNGVLVRVFLLDFFIFKIQKAQDFFVCCIRLPQQSTFIPIGNVIFGNAESAMLHDFNFYPVLNRFHIHCTVHLIAALFDFCRNFCNFRI